MNVVKGFYMGILLWAVMAVLWLIMHYVFGIEALGSRAVVPWLVSYLFVGVFSWLFSILFYRWTSDEPELMGGITLGIIFFLTLFVLTFLFVYFNILFGWNLGNLTLLNFLLDCREFMNYFLALIVPAFYYLIKY